MFKILVFFPFTVCSLVLLHSSLLVRNLQPNDSKTSWGDGLCECTFSIKPKFKGKKIIRQFSDQVVSEPTFSAVTPFQLISPTNQLHVWASFLPATVIENMGVSISLFQTPVLSQFPYLYYRVKVSYDFGNFLPGCHEFQTRSFVFSLTFQTWAIRKK